MGVDAMDFWLPVAVVFGGNPLFGIFCQIVKDNSWIDVWWGFTFVFPIVALFIKKWSQDGEIFLRQWLVLALVFIWALRLGLHIFVRHKGEDFRYQNWRREWQANGMCTYYLKAFLIVFALQALFSLIVNGAALYVTIFNSGSNLIWLDYVGVAVWAIGFIFEWVGDH